MADVDVLCYLQLESLKDLKGHLMKEVLKSTNIKCIYIRLSPWEKIYDREFIDVSSILYVCLMEWTATLLNIVSNRLC